MKKQFKDLVGNEFLYKIRYNSVYYTKELMKDTTVSWIKKIPIWGLGRSSDDKGKEKLLIHLSMPTYSNYNYITVDMDASEHDGYFVNKQDAEDKIQSLIIARIDSLEQLVKDIRKTNYEFLNRSRYEKDLENS